MNCTSGRLAIEAICDESEACADAAELIRVRGLVQGVGFRPMVWRLARAYGLRGWVANDGQGVSILACGTVAALAAFVEALPDQAPPLARIESIERESTGKRPDDDDFRIVASHAGSVLTHVVPDAATCPACLAEIFDPRTRRFRYPFTNCTHCGPRLSIIGSIPYDRATTTMRAFPLCIACAGEYADPGDRRFHAQPVACPHCGPRAWLEQAASAPVDLAALNALDDVDAACTLIQRGYIVAIKGLGGFQLACDACNDDAVSRLRELKQRQRKPLALMARDVTVVRRYCVVSEEEAALLQSPAAPIVILDTNFPARVAASVAPGMASLGFMLPNTPLHHLLLQRMERPLVLTSGNLSDEPQCIENADARNRLAGIADYFLMHDRGIARRVDDSVVRVMAGAPRLLRRARGYAPAPITLAHGFASVLPVLAMGGELKNSFCLLRAGQAVISHHMGDLADARCHADYQQSIDSYLQLFEHGSEIVTGFVAGFVAVDQHPEYLSRKLGLALAERNGLVYAEVQHHHAHIAACLAENNIPLEAEPVIGIALDGLGYGADGSLWGGEFLLADYRQCQRLGTFKPVALPGGEQAVYEPWRNTYAQLMAAMDLAKFADLGSELDLYRFLERKPRSLLDGMIARNVNSPLASSCGRLFDAVAAAAGGCRERVNYEGQAAVEFEALVDRNALLDEDDALAYPFEISRLPSSGLPYVEPLPMWQALLGDLRRGTPTGLIAARFHKGLARVIVRMTEALSHDNSGKQTVNTVALSGGVFQNRILLEQVVRRLESSGFRVLTHRQVAANDGGLALGQAVVAAARSQANSVNVAPATLESPIALWERGRG